MNKFLTARTQEALALKNRGPLKTLSNSTIDAEILDAYWDLGFYVFENVIHKEEMDEVRREFAELLERAPAGSHSETDEADRPLIFDDVERSLFRFVKPLSDPYGGTAVTGNRYQVKIAEPPVPEDAPAEVLLQIGGILQFLDSALRIYGHPELLKVAASVNGEDFTPFTEVIWLKQPKLGAAVSWHQDGTTHWDSDALDEGTHGFNFMLNLYETTAENSLWVVPKSHKNGKADIRGMRAQDSSDYLAGAVPLLCKPGDVAIVNRQIVHGSFPNQSNQPRYTFVFGFHRRSSVEGVQGWAKEPYTPQYLDTSCKLIPLAIAAREERFPAEEPYVYEPLYGRNSIQWNAPNRNQILKHYHRRAIGI